MCLALALAAGTAGAGAQAPAPLSLDPSVAGQGVTLLVAADGSLLSQGGAAPSSIAFALPRGMRTDLASRSKLCARAEAARAACPPESRIGFGRYVVDVAGFLAPGGTTQLSWSLAAYLAKPLQRGDAAAVVVTSTLLGAGDASALLAPVLGSPVPAAATMTGRLVRRSSGAFGLELSFPGLPVALTVSPPATATPSRLELSLSAVRRTRQNFVRRLRIPTPSGYTIQKVRDHRLIGHDLLRAPRSCRGSWPYELRVTFPAGVQRSAGRFACAKTLSAAPSAARRRA